MAKRKRLTPPRGDFLESGASGALGPDSPQAEPPIPADLETKSMFPSYPLGIDQSVRSSTARRVPPGASRSATAPIAAVAGDASASAALAAVSAEMEAARREGRMVQALPLDAVDAAYLIRDRIDMDPDEKRALRVSLRDRGQQTPIEVVALGDGRYGLISGWRRLTVLRELHADGSGTADAGAKPGTVLALVRAPAGAAEAYTAMVEENEIRVGLSYFERARIVSHAVRAGVCEDLGVALNALFAAASRSKRSKIKSFVVVVEALGDHLHFPTALSERLGLKLAQQLEAESAFAPRLRDRLRKAKPDSAEAETALLEKALRGEADRPPAPSLEEVVPGIFWVETRGGLKLSGPGLTPEVTARLRAALE